MLRRREVTLYRSIDLSPDQHEYEEAIQEAETAAASTEREIIGCRGGLLLGQGREK
jgi:hypothetical protein